MWEQMNTVYIYCTKTAACPIHGLIGKKKSLNLFEVSGWTTYRHTGVRKSKYSNMRSPLPPRIERRGGTFISSIYSTCQGSYHRSKVTAKAKHQTFVHKLPLRKDSLATLQKWRNLTVDII